MDAVGCHQLCAGQQAGCEAAVHAMREIYYDEDTGAVLLVDASNILLPLSLSCFPEYASFLHVLLWQPFSQTLIILHPICMFIEIISFLLQEEVSTQSDANVCNQHSPCYSTTVWSSQQVRYVNDAATDGNLLQLQICGFPLVICSAITNMLKSWFVKRISWLQHRVILIVDNVCWQP